MSTERDRPPNLLNNLHTARPSSGGVFGHVPINSASSIERDHSARMMDQLEEKLNIQEREMKQNGGEPKGGKRPAKSGGLFGLSSKTCIWIAVVLGILLLIWWMKSKKPADSAATARKAGAVYDPFADDFGGRERDKDAADDARFHRPGPISPGLSLGAASDTAPPGAVRIQPSSPDRLKPASASAPEPSAQQHQLAVTVAVLENRLREQQNTLGSVHLQLQKLTYWMQNWAYHSGHLQPPSGNGPDAGSGGEPVVTVQNEVAATTTDGEHKSEASAAADSPAQPSGVASPLSPIPQQQSLRAAPESAANSGSRDL